MKIIKDNRFSSVEVAIYFIASLENTLTVRNVVKDLLIESCKKYNSKQKMLFYLDTLYGATLNANSFIVGKNHIISFSGNVIHPKYSFNKENVVQMYLDFLSDVLFEPNDFALRLEEIKSQYMAKILRSGEEIAHTSQKEAIKTISNQTHLAIDYLGDVKILETLTLQDVKEAYQNMIKNDVMQVIVAGEITDLKFHHIQNKTINCFYRMKEIEAKKNNCIKTISTKLCKSCVCT